MSFTQVTVTGTVVLSNATDAAGATVTFTLNTPITDGTQIRRRRRRRERRIGDRTNHMAAMTKLAAPVASSSQADVV